MSAEPHPAVGLLLHVGRIARLRRRAGASTTSTCACGRDDAPTRAQLEAALGTARELPRIPGPAFHRLAFPAPDGQRPRHLFADIDDETGRAITLTARRNEL